MLTSMRCRHSDDAIRSASSDDDTPVYVGKMSTFDCGFTDNDIDCYGELCCVAFNVMASFEI